MANTSTRLRAFAKSMRHRPVTTERTLWRLLRDRRLEDLKFRRQVPIGKYIADFLCLRYRLIVEADGPFHENSAHDLERDAWLRGQGFRVLRFANSLIETRPHEVLAAIIGATKVLAERDRDPSSDPLRGPPSPARGEGNRETLVDARGHLCPVPTLRLRRALERAAPGALVRLLADDPLARIDVPHFAAAAGIEVIELTAHGTEINILLKIPL